MSTLNFRSGVDSGLHPTTANGEVAPIPAVCVATRLGQVDPKPTSTAAGHGIINPAIRPARPHLSEWKAAL